MGDINVVRKHEQQSRQNQSLMRTLMSLAKKQEGKCDYYALNWRCRGLHHGTVDGLAKGAAMQRLEAYLSRVRSRFSPQKTSRKVLITGGMMGGGRG